MVVLLLPVLLHGPDIFFSQRLLLYSDVHVAQLDQVVATAIGHGSSRHPAAVVVAAAVAAAAQDALWRGGRGVLAVDVGGGAGLVQLAQKVEQSRAVQL